MKPMVIAGTPDGLGQVPSTQQFLIGGALVLGVIWLLRKA